MYEAILEVGGELITIVLKTLLAVFGAWLTVKIGKKQDLAAINAAQQELIVMAQTTVGELMQTVVCKLKEASEDGKLSKEDIEYLGIMLIEQTVQKMSAPSIKLLRAAGVDINALITGAGEDWIQSIKNKQ